MTIEIVRSPEQETVELGLPGFMLALLFDSLRKNMGLEVRSDLEELANKSSAVPLVELDMFTQRRIARQMESDGYAILKASNESDIRVLTGAVCRWLCLLATRKIGIEENALMVALAISAEIDEMEDSWGNPKYMNVLMSRIDNEARRLGYFVVEQHEATD